MCAVWNKCSCWVTTTCLPALQNICCTGWCYTAVVSSCITNLTMFTSYHTIHSSFCRLHSIFLCTVIKKEWAQIHLLLLLHSYFKLLEIWGHISNTEFSAFKEYSLWNCLPFHFMENTLILQRLSTFFYCTSICVGVIWPHSQPNRILVFTCRRISHIYY